MKPAEQILEQILTELRLLRKDHTEARTAIEDAGELIPSRIRISDGPLTLADVAGFASQDAIYRDGVRAAIAELDPPEWVDKIGWLLR